MELDNVFDYLDSYLDKHYKGEPIDISDFYKGLLEEIHNIYMNTEGKSILGYGGISNQVPVFLIVDRTVQMNPDAMYISTFNPGKLLSNEYYGDFKDMLITIVEDEMLVEQIMSGKTTVIENGKNTIKRTGSDSGIEKMLALDDYISMTLMSSININSNLIVFQPEKIDPVKVFAATELPTVLDNDAIKYINGINKDMLKALYYSGEEGKDKVFEIINLTSLKAVPNMTLSEELLHDISLYKETRTITDNLEDHIKELASQLNASISVGGVLTVDNTPFKLEYRNENNNFSFLEGNTELFHLETSGSDVIAIDNIISNYSDKKNQLHEKYNENLLENENTVSFQSSKPRDNMLETMGNDIDTYVKFLKFQGTMYKQNPNNVLDFYVQNRDIKFLATETQWQKLNCPIKSGEKAIKGTDRSGNQRNLYDISQVKTDNIQSLPKIWTINKFNAPVIKSKLNIDSETSLLNGIVNGHIEKNDIIDCVRKINVPKSQLNSFVKEYMEGVRCVIAGRFEFGGNQINGLTATNTIFSSLETENKMNFISSISQSAGRVLQYVESIANNLANENLQNDSMNASENSISFLDNNSDTKYTENIGDMMDKLDDFADNIEDDYDNDFVR